jgi:broad specificity phosphatase PhoE
VIFVRHGRALVRRDVPTHEWPLDPESIGDIEQLRVSLPGLPVVCSDMRRAVDTARHFGEPTIDPRLAEVWRPWTHD